MDKKSFTLGLVCGLAVLVMGAGQIVTGFLQQATPTWKDLEFPAAAINPAGAPTPATYDPDEVCWTFAGNAENAIALTWQRNHDIKAGSVYIPHLHLMSAGTDTAPMDWRLVTVFQRFGDTNGFSISTVTNLFSWTPPGVANVHGISICGTNTPVIPETLSAIIRAKLYRLDNANNDAARLIGVDLHVQIDGCGSDAELSKSY